MKKTFKFMMLLVMAFTIALSSCKKDEETASGNNNGGGNNPVITNQLVFDGAKTDIVMGVYTFTDDVPTLGLIDEDDNIVLFMFNDDSLPTGEFDLDIQKMEVIGGLQYDDITYVAISGDLNIGKNGSVYTIESNGKLTDEYYEDTYSFSCTYKGELVSDAKSIDSSKIVKIVKVIRK